MSFNLMKILKGLLISEENVLNPKEIQIQPGGTSGTKTTIESTQTTNKTLLLPNANDTLVGKATSDVLTNKSIDATTNTLTNISNSSISSTAAIALNKMEALTASKALISDSLGVVSPSTVTSTELSYVSGVTSSIQTQLNAKGTITIPDGGTLSGTYLRDVYLAGTAYVAVSSSVIIKGNLYGLGNNSDVLSLLTGSSLEVYGDVTIRQAVILDDSSVNFIVHQDFTQMAEGTVNNYNDLATNNSFTIHGHYNGLGLNLGSNTNLYIGKDCRIDLKVPSETSSYTSDIYQIYGNVISSFNIGGDLILSNSGTYYSTSDASDYNIFGVLFTGVSNVINIKGSIIGNGATPAPESLLVPLANNAVLNVGKDVNTTAINISYSQYNNVNPPVFTLNVSGNYNGSLFASGGNCINSSSSLVGGGAGAIVNIGGNVTSDNFSLTGGSRLSTLITGSNSTAYAGAVSIKGICNIGSLSMVGGSNVSGNAGSAGTLNLSGFSKIQNLGFTNGAGSDPVATPIVAINGYTTIETFNGSVASYVNGTASALLRISFCSGPKKTINNGDVTHQPVTIDTDILYSYKSGSWTPASGFNNGIKNYIKNGHAEIDVTGWSTYKDVAGIQPVDGTGGTASRISISTTITTPLSGNKSFQIAHSGGGSAQGEGVSYDFTIDAKDRSKVLQISFDYMLTSGTFVPGSVGVDSSLEVFIYNVTTSTLVSTSSYKLLSNSTTVPSKFGATFTSDLVGSYRLILHCPSTATIAWALKLDSISVNSSQYYGIDGSIVGTTDTQTLTNKTIDAVSNTLSNISNSAISATAAIDASKLANGLVSNTEFQYLDGVTSSIQTQLNAKALTSDLTTHTGLSSGVHGTVGSVVGTSDTQILTNKDHDGGVASNASRITLPKAAKTVLDGLTRKQGTIVYDTTSNKPFFDNGTTLSVIGSGSGSTNFITTGDAETGTTGFVTYTNTAQSRPVTGV